MRPRLHVHGVDPSHPDGAAQAGMAGVTPALTRRRPLVLCSVAWSSTPGMRPAIWTARGALAALSEAGHPPAQIQRVSVDAGDPARSRDAARWRDPQTHLRLTLPGHRRPLAIPRTWIGSSLLLLIPLLHHGRRKVLGQESSWTGPLESALGAVAQACGGDPRARHFDSLGRDLCDAVFAGVVVIIDGTWWGATIDDCAQPTDLVPVGRCITAVWSRSRDTARIVDDWLDTQLGLRRGGATTSIVTRGDTQVPWPRVSLPRHPQSFVRAGRRLNPLRPAGHPGPALVPGPLARSWHPDTALEPGAS